MGLGDINLIAKIAPKNDAFVGMVDAEQVIVDASGFTGNLSATDTDAQTAFETLDTLSTSSEVDGGFCNSVYLVPQLIDGGGA